MQTPGLKKREYKFRSKRKGDQWSFTIAIIISIIAFLLIWFYL
jgi:hypothetical protein